MDAFFKQWMKYLAAIGGVAAFLLLFAGAPLWFWMYMLPDNPAVGIPAWFFTMTLIGTGVVAYLETRE